MEMSEALTYVKETYFTQSRMHLAVLASQMVDDVEAVIERTEVLFDEMLPDMAYLDDPENFMASAVYMCSTHFELRCPTPRCQIVQQPLSTNRRPTDRRCGCQCSAERR